MSVRPGGCARVLRAAAVASALVVAVTGCSGSADAMPAPSPSPTATPVAPYGDGTLTIATLLPRDDPDRSTAEIAGVEAVIRDAQAATAAGAAGLPSVRTLHRPLNAAGDGSVAASVADLAGRGADVLLVRADAASLAEIVRAAEERRLAVLPLDSPLAPHPGPGLAASAYASPSASAMDLIDAAASDGDRPVIAIRDDLGDAAVEAMLADDRPEVVRVAADGVLTRREAARVVEAATGAIVIGRASSPAVAATVGALVEAGADPTTIVVASDVPIAGQAGPDLVPSGVRGFVAAPAATDLEAARVRADDPSVADGLAGVAASRMATLAVLSAAAAGDDGGQSVLQALPRTIGGDSVCSAIAPCIDALSRGIPVAFLPVTGMAVDYAAGATTVTGALPR